MEKDKISYYRFLARVLTIRELLIISINKFVLINEKLHKYHCQLYLIWQSFDVDVVDKKLIVYDINRHKISLRLSSSDISVFHQIMIQKDYQPLIDLALSMDINNLNVIDLGANIGLTSIFLYEALHPNRTIAIEPDRENYLLMLENCKGYNNFQGGNYAVWSDDITLSLSNDFRDGRQWSLRVSDKRDVSGVLVTGKRLASIIEEFEIEKIDILKIDVEGAERELFLNDELFLSIVKEVKLLAVEAHSESIDENVIIALLVRSGFCVFKKGELIIGVNNDEKK